MIKALLKKKNGQLNNEKEDLDFVSPRRRVKTHPIWYAVHLSKPVVVTQESPQKKFRPPTTIAT